VADEFKLTGIPELEAALTEAGGLALEAFASAMLQEQEQIISDAKRLTPVDTGVLRASGTVLPPVITGTQVEVQAGFGGAASAYAVPVHERMGVHHPTGQAKFLEQPFLERAATLPAKLAAKVAAAFERLAR